MDVCQGFDIVLRRTILRTIPGEFQGNRGQGAFPTFVYFQKKFCGEIKAPSGYVDGFKGGGYNVWAE